MQKLQAMSSLSVRVPIELTSFISGCISSHVQVLLLPDPGLEPMTLRLVSNQMLSPN